LICSAAKVEQEEAKSSEIAEKKRYIPVLIISWLQEKALQVALYYIIVYRCVSANCNDFVGPWFFMYFTGNLDNGCDGKLMAMTLQIASVYQHIIA